MDPSPSSIRATFLSHRSVSAAILVDGELLEVFRPEYDRESQTLTGWVASEIGKEFSVCVRKENARIVNTAIKANVFLDGASTEACSAVLHKKVPRNEWRQLSGEAVDLEHGKPFVFSKIDATDNDDYLYNHSAKCPGDIVLEIWRVAVGHSVKKWKAQDIVTNPGVIHETSKKAGAHATKLGSSRAFKTTWQLTEDMDEQPWATFVFKYRPAALLQAEGLMPKAQGKRKRDGEASDDEDEEGSDGEDEAEIYALQASLNAKVLARAQRKRLKVEALKSQLYGRARSSVTTEEGSNEVIDLTGDDDD